MRSVSSGQQVLRICGVDYEDETCNGIQTDTECGYTSNFLMYMIIYRLELRVAFVLFERP